MNRNLWILVLPVMVGAIMLDGSPVKAQDLCSPGYFCDRDGDSFYKEHKRCDCDGPIDCDDDDPSNDCADGEPPSFMATLTDGPFGFDQAGPVIFTLSDQALGNRATNDDEKLNLTRCGDALVPDCGDVWDAVFDMCSVLLSGEIPTGFEVAIGNATIAKSSEDIRITFYDFEAFDAEGRGARMELHLIGTTYSPHDLGDPIAYTLDTFAIYGQSVGPGRKKKCQFGNRDTPGSSSFLTVP